MAAPKQAEIDNAQELLGEEQPTGQASGSLQPNGVLKDGERTPPGSDDNLVAIAESGPLHTGIVEKGLPTWEKVEMKDNRTADGGYGPGRKFQMESFLNTFEGILDGPYGPYDSLTKRDLTTILSSIPEEPFYTVEEFRAGGNLTRETRATGEVSAPSSVVDAARIQPDPTKQLGMAETRGQVIFLAIGFIVGIVVGFAVARSL